LCKGEIVNEGSSWEIPNEREKQLDDWFLVELDDDRTSHEQAEGATFLYRRSIHQVKQKRDPVPLSAVPRPLQPTQPQTEKLNIEFLLSVSATSIMARNSTNVYGDIESCLPPWGQITPFGEKRVRTSKQANPNDTLHPHPVRW
jgi:hypothetical protein